MIKPACHTDMSRRSYTRVEALDPRNTELGPESVQVSGYADAPYTPKAPKWLRGGRDGPGAKRI